MYLLQSSQYRLYDICLHFQYCVPKHCLIWKGIFKAYICCLGKWVVFKEKNLIELFNIYKNRKNQLQSFEFKCRGLKFEFSRLNSNEGIWNLNSVHWIQMYKLGIWIQYTEFKCRNFKFEFSTLNSNVEVSNLNSVDWIQFFLSKFMNSNHFVYILFSFHQKQINQNVLMFICFENHYIQSQILKDSYSKKTSQYRLIVSLSK